MIKLFSPETEIELAFLKGILEAEKIHYYVKNDHFGNLRPGPQIYLFNAKTIYVSESDIERAENILCDFLKISRREDQEKSYSLLDRVRMTLEALLFGWFMPGKMGYGKQKPND
jgi:transcription termination factor Rho